MMSGNEEKRSTFQPPAVEIQQIPLFTNSLTPSSDHNRTIFHRLRSLHWK